MSARQRLPLVGARLLRSLAGDAAAGPAAARAAGLQCSRAFSRLVGGRAAGRVPCSAAAALCGALQQQPSSLLSLAAARGFAAAADLPPHEELAMPSLSPTMNQVRVCGCVPAGQRRQGTRCSGPGVTLRREAQPARALARVTAGPLTPPAWMHRTPAGQHRDLEEAGGRLGAAGRHPV